jgi:hypothetical protein
LLLRGKVSNSATTAASANTASAIVARDASGNFTAGTITAALTGAASSNVLKAGDTMTGALVVPLASAATPSLTFTGDLDTGVFSPGANQVAVATNGTGRLFVDASGNVKVGSTDNSNAGVRYITVGAPGTTAGGLQLWGTTTGESYVQFGDGTASADNYRGYMAYSHLNDALTFGTATTERARIDSSGRLLVGTSSDSGGALFQVNGDRIRVGTAKTPATSGATGTTGEIAWDADYIYVCTATFDTTMRVTGI